MSNGTYDKKAFLSEFEEAVKEMKKLSGQERDKDAASSWRERLKEKE